MFWDRFKDEGVVLAFSSLFWSIFEDEMPGRGRAGRPGYFAEGRR
jgi:hypothetical protein